MRCMHDVVSTPPTNLLRSGKLAGRKNMHVFVHTKVEYFKHGSKIYFWRILSSRGRSNQRHCRACRKMLLSRSKIRYHNVLQLLLHKVRLFLRVTRNACCKMSSTWSVCGSVILLSNVRKKWLKSLLISLTKVGFGKRCRHSSVISQHSLVLF